MKTTLKEFLKEQASLGINVPKIYENEYCAPEKEENENEENEEKETSERFNSIIEKLSAQDKQELIKMLTTEGFFDKIKDVFSGAIQYNIGNNYAGSKEAQDFLVKDRRSKVQIETLMKKGLSEQEAKSAVMYIFDKNDKNALGFVGKVVNYDPATKTLKVSNSPGLGTENI